MEIENLNIEIEIIITTKLRKLLKLILKILLKLRLKFLLVKWLKTVRKIVNGNLSLYHLSFIISFHCFKLLNCIWYILTHFWQYILWLAWLALTNCKNETYDFHNIININNNDINNNINNNIINKQQQFEKNLTRVFFANIIWINIILRECA